MFSTTQLETLEGLVPALRAEGYLYYLAITDNYRSDSSAPDLIVYFSKEEIISADTLNFHIPSDSLVYSIRTSNASSYNQTPRFIFETLELPEFVDVDEFEFVSTNATFAESAYIQPDYLVGEVGSYEIQGALLLTVCSFLLFMFFVKLFRR